MSKQKQNTLGIENFHAKVWNGQIYSENETWKSWYSKKKLYATNHNKCAINIFDSRKQYYSEYVPAPTESARLVTTSSNLVEIHEILMEIEWQSMGYIYLYSALEHFDTYPSTTTNFYVLRN